MLHCRRITVITPEFSEPLLNQEIKVSSKIRSMSLMGSGTCEYTVKFEKDVLYPKDVIKLQVDINNEKCSKKIDKYKIKLLRRTQVFNLKTTKPIYTNDFILVSEKMESKCEAKKKEVKTFEFQIPQSIFISEGEEERIKVPLKEKSLA
jgi:sporulation-control protein spo0M